MKLPTFSPNIVDPEFRGENGRSAIQIAEIIRKVWHDLGHKTVKTWVEKYDLTTEFGNKLNQRKHIEFVKSNLVNGLPPKLEG